MKSSKKVKIQLIVIAFTVVVMGLTLASGAYTDDLSITSATITTSSNTNYDYELDFTYKYRFNNNFSILKIYFSVVEDGYSTTVTSTVVTVNNYVNGTSGTNGLVTTTGVLYFTTNNIPHTSKNDRLLLRAFAYNNSISTANLLDSDNEAVTFPYFNESASSSSDSEGVSWTTYLVLILSGVGLIVVVLVILMQITPTRNFIVGLGASVPIIRNRVKATKGDEIVYSTGTKRYAVRDPKGKFREIK